MSLATRCSACGTVFRVQQDQLKASEGWVRCGRCGTVFSALEGLFDLEREHHSQPMPLQPAASAPAPAPAASAAIAPVPMPAVGAPPPAPAPAVDYVLPDDDPTGAQSDEEDIHLASSSEEPTLAVDLDLDSVAEEAASTAAFSASSHHDPHEEDAELLTEHSGHHTVAESWPAESLPIPLNTQAPSFLRESEQDIRWRKQRPVVRRLTIAAAFALPLVLAAQVVLHQRDTVAARWPAMAPVLNAVCVPLECTVAPPRALEALSVESSGLSRVDGTALYRLQVAVRNRAAWAVQMPSFDVALTDTRGDVVTRRMLKAADLGGSAPAELAGGAEWSTLATIDVGDRRIAGYTIDLFYP